LKIPSSDNFLKKPAPSTQQQQHHAQTGPSHIAIFLTNLRLLDLDRRKHWPGITSVTFATKDSQQNIKRRIQCVEWALYELFCLWDPEETREVGTCLAFIRGYKLITVVSQKLQPFFPPLEPLQSLNLRAALFRCLDQAKKNGILGRDAVLRKTMLDECKGERLEEVLAVFSTAVVKHLVQESHTGHEAVSQRLAMENFSYTGERSGLSALVLAHKYSLRQIIVRKDEAKKQYNDFSDLLKLKDRQITRRHEQLKVAIEEDESTEYIAKPETYALQETVRKNWYGSNEWLESILHGDGRFDNDGLLSQPYDNVWKHVENGRIGEIEDSHRKGLLEHLDARVKEQSNRLEKWQNFEKTIKARRTGARNEKVPKSTKVVASLDLAFGAHESLQLPSNPLKSTKTWQPHPDQARLIEGLQKELANVGKPKHYESPAKRRVSVRQEPQSPSPSPEPVEERPPRDEENDWVSNSDSDDQSVDLERPSSHTSPSGPVEEEPKAVSTEPSPESAPEPSPEAEPLSEVEEVPEVVSHSPSPSATYPISTSSTMPPPPLPLPKTRSSIHTTMLPPSPPSPDIATQILNSMAAASPSPVKPRHVLSLAERTRMSMSRVSMSRNSLAHLEDFDDLPDLPQLPSYPKIRLSRVPDLHSNDEASLEDAEAAATAAKARRHEDLIARTRLSLSNSASVAKSAQIERRRSVKLAAKKKRESYMPKPHMLEPTLEGDDGEVIDRLALIEAEPQDVDYEAVFKSRPKIKTSPARSPVKAWVEMGGERDMGSSSPVPPL